MTNEIVDEHYTVIAEEHGNSEISTISDYVIRNKELEHISNAIDLFENDRILEVGCGNGYVARNLLCDIKSNYVGLDFNRDMIELANKIKLDDSHFIRSDVCDLPFGKGTFDFIFSERCLINLEDWNNQMSALQQIFNSLSSGGHYLMIESFVEPQEKLDQARDDVGLEKIGAPWHNRFFEENKLTNFIAEHSTIEDVTSKYIDQLPPNFLSTYYFFSRVLYPALANSNDKAVKFNSEFVQFFKYIPPLGDYANIKSKLYRKFDN